MGAQRHLNRKCQAQLAQEVALADVHAVMSQDRVGGGRMEEEVRQQPAAQVGQAFHLDRAVRQLDRDVAIFSAFERARRHRLDVVDGLLDARAKFLNGLLGVFELRRVDARETRDAEFRTRR